MVWGEAVVMVAKAGIELEPHQLLVDPKLNLGCHAPTLSLSLLK